MFILCWKHYNDIMNSITYGIVPAPATDTPILPTSPTPISHNMDYYSIASSFQHLVIARQMDLQNAILDYIRRRFGIRSAIANISVLLLIMDPLKFWEVIRKYAHILWDYYNQCKQILCRHILALTVWDLVVIDIDVDDVDDVDVPEDHLSYIERNIQRYYPDDLFYINKTARGYHVYLVSRTVTHCSKAAIYIYI